MDCVAKVICVSPTRRAASITVTTDWWGAVASALIFWRYFRGRVDAYLLTLELASEQFVRHILRHRK